MTNKKMHSIFVSTLLEDYWFERQRSRPFNFGLECVA